LFDEALTGPGPGRPLPLALPRVRWVS